MKKTLIRALSLSLAALLGSCSPVGPVPDAQPRVETQRAGLSDENVAWAQQAITVLYGRRPRNHDELSTVRDMVRTGGKETTARVLMMSREFTNHWSDVLLDFLRMDRQGERYDNDCFAKQSPPYDAPALADIIASGATLPIPLVLPDGTIRNPNMDDVVRSSIVADNIYPVYRAAIYAMHNQGSPDTNASAFIGTMVNRQLLCSQCHRADFSRTATRPEFRSNPTERLGLYERAIVDNPVTLTVVDWNRTHTTTPGDSPTWLELSLWDEAIFTQSRTLFDRFFNTDQRSGATAPWRLHACGTWSEPPASSTPQTGRFAKENFATPSLSSLEDLLDRGKRAITPAPGYVAGGLARTPSSACTICSDGMTCTPGAGTPGVGDAAEAERAMNTFLNDRCVSCHNPAGMMPAIDFSIGIRPWVRADVFGNVAITPQSTAASRIYEVVSTGRMPRGAPLTGTALSYALTTIATYVNSLNTNAGCEVCSSLDVCREVVPQGADAFAFVVAQGIANRVFEETMGGPLTVPHGLPRNASQRRQLDLLTRTVFLQNNWSLKSLLVEIMQLPEFSAAPVAEYLSPYVFPLTSNPWGQLDMRGKQLGDSRYTQHLPANWDQQQNGVGDRLVRMRAQTLLRSAYTALGWGTPEVRFPTGALRSSARAMGLALDSSQPGTRITSLQDLLRWEATFGLCEKPAGVATDFIDHLTTHAAGRTRRELVMALRDRIINDSNPLSTGSTGEEGTLTTLLGGSLDATLASGAGLDAPLRQVCGTLFISPQFLLQGFGVPTIGPRPWLPAMAFQGESTSAQQVCEQYSPLATAAGWVLTCTASGADLHGTSVGFDWDRYCPRAQCLMLADRLLRFCPQCPIGFRLPPRGIDPREGDPLPIPGNRGTALWYGHLATVSYASGVERLGLKDTQWMALKGGETLFEGDALRISNGAVFEFALGNDKVGNPDKEMPKHDLGIAYELLITGPSFVKPIDVAVSNQPQPPITRSAPLQLPLSINIAQPVYGGKFGRIKAISLSAKLNGQPLPQGWELQWIATPLNGSGAAFGVAKRAGSWSTTSFTADGIGLAKDPQSCNTAAGQGVTLMALVRNPQGQVGRAQTQIRLSCQ